MPRLVGKADKFILDAWAIPWSDAFYLTTVHCGQMKVVANDLSGLGRGVCHPARNLFTTRSPSQATLTRVFHVEQIAIAPGIVKSKKCRCPVAFLLLHFREIDAATEQPWW